MMDCDKHSFPLYARCVLGCTDPRGEACPAGTLDALKECNAALTELSARAGDVAFWNRGGMGYRANSAARRMLDAAGE